MKKRVTSFWKWIRDHLRLSIALAVLLLVGAVYVIPLFSPPRGQECGTINYPNSPLQRTAAIHAASLKVLSCFWQAYQHCQRATISLSAIGTNMGEDVTVIVRHGKTKEE